VDRIPPAAESQSGTLVDRLERNPALAPQRDSQDGLTRDGHHHNDTPYPKLEEMTGQYTSWHGCGGIRLATVIKSESAYDPKSEHLRA
jgi:hypothetical protein